MDPLTKPKTQPDEINLELTLRPTTWEEYIGQEKVKTNLRLIIEAAKGRKETCDHILFYGQPGLGKTTLAYLIGKEMGVTVRSTSGPALEKAGDVAALLTNLEPHEILFIDEAHRINKLVEEILYPAMESRKLHLIVGKGPSARTFSLDLPPFTIVAATTKANMLSSPLRSRFGATFHLDYYEPKDIEKILARSARLLGVQVTKEALAKLAAAARFTPRIANRLLKRARDYAQVYQNNKVDEVVAQKTLEMLEIDELGLEHTDRELLLAIIKKFNGGPVGLNALGAALNEEVGTIEDVYEPFLMKLGLLHRSPTGRVATQNAYEHLNVQKKSSLV
ncbi:MAG: Holliday junction branch migration DNA helicase RuvB [Candidatus Jorgensenbacteria bacterium]|nr:Holliday junction branch migration DNA helicase RuvB [Candidatus Jorgensenbacteria bacterium]